MAYTPSVLSKTSADGVNSYSATTGGGWAGNIFTGAGEQNIFNYVGVNLQVDEGGTLTFQFSQDGTNWSNYPVTQFTVVSGINEVHGAWKGTRYVRPIFTGVDGSRTYFRLSTMYSYAPIILSAPLNQNINPDQDASVVRSVIIGQDPAGNFRNSTADEHGDLKVHIDEPKTAFGELMTADMEPVIQITFPYNINTNIVTPITSSVNASITQANQMAVISTGATANTSASLESIHKAKYRAGQGMDVRFTALFTTGSSVGTQQLAGIGSIENGIPQDGYFFAMSGSSFGVWTYNQGVGSFISSSAFSTDILDGGAGTNNPSGMNINPEKGNVYGIKYQWLGFGAIKFFVEDPAKGYYSEVHNIQYANNNIIPSSENPTFPIVYYATNGSNAENVEVKTGSGAVFVAGKNKITGPTNSTGSIIAHSNGADTLAFALEGVPFMPSGSSKVNRINSFIRSLTISNEGANNTVIGLEVYENIIVSSSVNNYIDNNNSAVRAVNGGYTAGSGRLLTKFSIPRGTGRFENLIEFNYEVQPNKNIAFVITGDTSTATEVLVSWVEDF